MLLLLMFIHLSILSLAIHLIQITIECDRLVPGQVIQFDADTTGTELYRDVQPDETESIYQYFTLTV